MEFDLNRALQGLGYIGLPFPLGKLELPDFEEKFSQLGSSLTGKTELGRDIYMPIVLKSGLFEVQLDYAVVNITGRKRVVTTPLLKRKGEVHEIVSLNSYKFSVRGVFVDRWDSRTAVLIDFFESSENLYLSSALTDIVLPGDNTVVMTSLKLPDMQGKGKIQYYEFDLIEDANLEIEL